MEKGNINLYLGGAPGSLLIYFIISVITPCQGNLRNNKINKPGA